MAQKARQTTYANYYGDFGQYQYEGQEVEEEEECGSLMFCIVDFNLEPPEDSLAQYTVDPPLVERPELMAGPSRLTSDPDPEFSDDSDEENDIVGKVNWVLQLSNRIFRLPPVVRLTSRRHEFVVSVTELFPVIRV